MTGCYKQDDDVLLSVHMSDGAFGWNDTHGLAMDDWKNGCIMTANGVCRRGN